MKDMLKEFAEFIDERNKNHYADKEGIEDFKKQASNMVDEADRCAVLITDKGIMARGSTHAILTSIACACEGLKKDKNIPAGIFKALFEDIIEDDKEERKSTDELMKELEELINKM